jgi:phenol 2-monooxygenase
MEEVAFWNPLSKDAQQKGTGSRTGIERTDRASDVNVPARFPFEVTIY